MNQNKKIESEFKQCIEALKVTNETLQSYTLKSETRLDAIESAFTTMSTQLLELTRLVQSSIEFNKENASRIEHIDKNVQLLSETLDELMPMVNSSKTRIDALEEIVEQLQEDVKALTADQTTRKWRWILGGILVIALIELPVVVLFALEVMNVIGK